MTRIESSNSLKLDVVKGNPDPEELAALTAVMLSLPELPRKDYLTKNSNAWLAYRKTFVTQQVPVVSNWKNSLR